jgi:hypothetical protein
MSKARGLLDQPSDVGAAGAGAEVGSAHQADSRGCDGQISPRRLAAGRGTVRRGLRRIGRWVPLIDPMIQALTTVLARMGYRVRVELDDFNLLMAIVTGVIED